MNNIEFSKPKARPGYRCVDMHFHTVHSDGAATAEQILKRIRELDIGVAITDHNEINGSLEAFSKKKGSDFIIPAIEVKSKEGIDILFYFYEVDELKEFFRKEIEMHRKKMLYLHSSTIPLRRLYELSGKYDCISSVAHPFGYSMRGGTAKTFEKNEHILKKFDVVEAINGGTSRKNNSRAVDYIEKSLKAYSGGSDGHSIYPLGNVVTCSKAKTVREFLDNIKEKKNLVYGNEMRFGKFGEYFYFGKNKIKGLGR